MKGRGIIIQKRRHNARDSSNNKASDNVFFLDSQPQLLVH